MAAHRIYHWKHGWIPLDHYAALKKAKGSDKGARKYLARSHAQGHAHHSVVSGTHHNGTHIRGLQPVAGEHLPRQAHIVAAFHPQSRSFHLMDQRGSRIGLTHEHDGKPLLATIHENVADKLNQHGYQIHALRHTPNGDLLIVGNAQGELKAIRADGADIHMIEPRKPPKVEPPKPPEPPKATPPKAPRAPRASTTTPKAPAQEFAGYAATHKLSRHSRPISGQMLGSGTRSTSYVRTVDGYGGGFRIDEGLADHIERNDLRIIGAARQTVTTVNRAGDIHRYKADGSNINNPVKARVKAFQRVDIAGWEHVDPAGAVPNDGMRAMRAAKVKRAYVKGNKRIIIEAPLTQDQAERFVADVEKALELTRAETGHLDMTIHVPTGDPTMRRAYGYVYQGHTQRVHINPSVASGAVSPNENTNGYKMPALNQPGMTQALYTLTHELGHIVDIDRNHTGGMTNRGQGLPRERMLEERRFHANQHASLSGYGNTQLVEGYAEAYAQHKLQPGVNPAANAYAGRYGWR